MVNQHRIQTPIWKGMCCWVSFCMYVYIYICAYIYIYYRYYLSPWTWGGGRWRGRIPFSCPNHAFRPLLFIWNLNPKPRQTCACRSLSLECGESRLLFNNVLSSPLHSPPNLPKQHNWRPCLKPVVLREALPGGLGRRGSEEWKERTKGKEKGEIVENQWKSTGWTNLPPKKKRNP